MVSLLLMMMIVHCQSGLKQESFRPEEESWDSAKHFSFWRNFAKDWNRISSNDKFWLKSRRIKFYHLNSIYLHLFCRNNWSSEKVIYQFSIVEDQNHGAFIYICHVVENRFDGDVCRDLGSVPEVRTPCPNLGHLPVKFKS